MSTKRFSGVLIDAAQSYGAMLSKVRKSEGTIIKGVRFREKDEESWAKKVENVGSGVGNVGSMQGELQVNPLIMKEVQDNGSDTPYINNNKEEEADVEKAKGQTALIRTNYPTHPTLHSLSSTYPTPNQTSPYILPIDPSLSGTYVGDDEIEVIL